MSCADIVNSIGLSLDILGVVLLFFFGLPARVRETGGTTIRWGGGKSDEEAWKEYRRYRCFGRTGLALLVCGFTLQLLSNIPWLVG